MKKLVLNKKSKKHLKKLVLYDLILMNYIFIKGDTLWEINLPQ